MAAPLVASLSSKLSSSIYKSPVDSATIDFWACNIRAQLCKMQPPGTRANSKPSTAWYQMREQSAACRSTAYQGNPHRRIQMQNSNLAAMLTTEEGAAAAIMLERNASIPVTHSTIIQQQPCVQPSQVNRGESLAAKTSDGASISRQCCSNAGVASLFVHNSGAVGRKLAGCDDDWLG